MTDHDEYEWVLKDGLTKKNLAHADIPIANAFRNVLCFLMLLTLLSACSKDDDSVDPAEIGGKFGCFEGEQNGEIFKLPEDGFGIDIQINRLDEKNATVEIIPYGNQEPIDFPIQQCSIETDQDGFVVLLSKEDRSLYVIFYDAATIDCYPGGGTRLSASRNGQEPGWWDE